MVVSISIEQICLRKDPPILDGYSNAKCIADSEKLNQLVGTSLLSEAHLYLKNSPNKLV